MPEFRTNQIIAVSLVAMVTAVTIFYFSWRPPKPSTPDLNKGKSKDDNQEMHRVESQKVEAKQLSENTDIKKNSQQASSRVGDVSDSPPSLEKQQPLNNGRNKTITDNNILAPKLQEPRKEPQSSEALIEAILVNLASVPRTPPDLHEKCEVAVPYDETPVFDEKTEVAVPYEPVPDTVADVDTNVKTADSNEKPENKSMQRKSSVNTHVSRDSGYEEIATVSKSNLNWKAAEFTPPSLNVNARVFVPTFIPPTPELPQTGPPARTDLETPPTSGSSHPHGSAIKKVRCKYWPRCTNKNCKFVHPRLPCRNDGFCHFGDKCIYIHTSDNITPGEDLDRMGRRSRGSRNSLHEQYMIDGRRSSGSSFNSHNGH